MLKKILILLVLAVAVAAIVILGKGLLTGFKSEPVTLTYWGLWEPEETLKPLFTEFEKTHSNVKINYVKQSPIEYRERLQNSLEKGEGPDLFRYHNTWLPMIKDNLAPLPLTVMLVQTYQNTYPPVVYDNLSFGGKIYGIPLYIDTLALFYNEDLFQQGGVTPPATWDDLRKIAQQLTVRDADDRIKIAGAALGTAGNVDHFSDILGIMFLQNGTDMKKVASTIGSDGHNLGEDTIKFYTNFALEDKVWDETMNSSTVAFAAGKVAMYFGPSWEVFEIQKLSESSPVKVNFKVVPLPQLPRKTLNWASYWAEGVSIKSKNQNLSWELLKFLSSKENLPKFYTEASKIRLFGEPYPRKDMVEMLKADQLVSPFVTQAETATSWYLSSRTFDNGLNDKNIKYLEDAVNSILKGEEPLRALQTVEKGFNQVLSQYGLAPAPIPTQ